MIAHVAFDESFINYSIGQFETLWPGRNRFYILTRRTGEQLTGITASPVTEAVGIRSPGDVRSLAARLRSAEVVVIHRMDYLCARLVRHLAPEQRVLWVYWGVEVYNRLPEFEDFLYGSQTRRHLPWVKMAAFKAVKLSVGRAISRGCGDRLPWLFRKYPCSHGEYRASLRRPQYLGLFLREDYELVRSRVAIPDRRVWYIYYNVEEVVGASLLNAEASGDGILIGNSATLTNNHLEAFRAVAALDCRGHTIHVPLSYGVRSYARVVAAEGRRAFGATFHPMPELLPRDDYNRVLLACPVVIMNHHRQQAIGNILTALWLGARLYLSEQCPTFPYLRRLGVHCFSVESDLVPGNPRALDPLPPGARVRNREVLAHWFSKERVYARVREEVETILGE